KLLDSICFDPVSVDKGFVATGAKFTRRDNVIYLQLRQARLSNGRLTETTKKWIDLKRCSPANTKPVFNSDRNKYLEIKLEDIILPENAVVTGVTLGESVQGRYLNDNLNFDEKRGEVTQRSQCSGSTTYSVFRNYQVKPSTGVSIRENNEFSKSCQSHISFQGSSQDNEKLPYVVPYVDLREIVTESPEAIRGIGWHHRSFPGYGGFLALKIFKKV
ncbi:GSCOCG00002512001-RA-CDS, partial [Cotesia congregata]